MKSFKTKSKARRIRKDIKRHESAALQHYQKADLDSYMMHKRIINDLEKELHDLYYVDGTSVIKSLKELLNIQR